MKIFFTLTMLAISSILTAQTTRQRISESTLSPDLKSLLLQWDNQKQANQTATSVFAPLQFHYHRVSNAPKDGCYYGLGDSRNEYTFNGMNQSQCAACETAGGKIKTNESYIWGLTQGNDQIYFGVNSNYLCLAMLELLQASPIEMPAYENECWVCEYGKSNYKDPWGDSWGDWIAPSIYHYDPKSRKNENVSPINNEDLKNVYGLRAAGSLGNVSLIAGPNKEGKGVTFFAYNNETNEFLGSKSLNQVPGFEGYIPGNIRRAIVVNNVLYFGIQYRVGKVGGGALLRWRGDATDPFKFEVVGWIPKGATEFALLNNRIYAGTWPFAIYRSEEIPADGLQPKGAPDGEKKWELIFDYSTYEPDAGQARMTLSGAMTTYQDQIYVGTIHLSWANLFKNSQLYNCNPKENPIGFIKAYLGSHRATSLFRISIADDPEIQPLQENTPLPAQIHNGHKIELLYGEKELPAFNPETNDWEIKPTGWDPLFGRSGFNNMFNNYTWSAQVYDSKLFLGTMDYSSLIVPEIESVLEIVGSPLKDQLKEILYDLMKGINPQGYSLMYFDNPLEKPQFITRNGLGNSAAYGVRNFVNVGDKMYMGIANPHSLLENGGWELIEVSKGCPFIEPKLVWTPQPITFGEKISDNQLNAKAIVDFKEIPGVYKYTYLWSDVPLDTILTPGYIDLRVEFTPQDTLKFARIKTKQRITINKTPLIVTAPNVEIEQGEEFPEDYKLIYEGFVLNHDENALEVLPTWSVIENPNGTTGLYTIKVSGGKSDLYDIQHINGNLILKVTNDIAENSEKRLSIYPIPVTDRIYFESESEIQTVVITNLDGRCVLSATLPGNSIDLSHLDNASYLMVIKTKESTMTRKIIINR